MEQIYHYIAKVEEALNSFTTSLSPSPLYEAVDYMIKLGGKRLRPAMVCLAADMFNGNKEEALQAALAVEIFHNFSLVHDDIMDAAPLRRNQATVHTKWNSNQAILSGDAMLVLAYRCLSKAGTNLPALHQCFDQVALEVCEGQQLDMDFEQRQEVSVSDYLEMIRLKTSVLLGAALEMGAVVADATIEQRDALRRFGIHLGMAFQLQDDYLDAFGAAEKVGKQVGGDILANKKTYLLIRLLEEVSARDNEILQDSMHKVMDPALKVASVKALMLKYGVDKELLSEKERHHLMAMSALNELEADPHYVLILESFATQLLEREY